MDTRPYPSRSSSTTRSTLIPAASSVANSQRCAIPSGRSSRSKRIEPTTNLPVHSCLKRPESQRPLQHAQDDVLDLADVVGKRLIDTRLKPKITIREENAIAALEVMSRFASDPKWLIYLPPTMSPTETSKHENLLEHPDEAFAFYRKEGIATVVCEQKHMGSRAVVVLCKDETVSQKRFGVVKRRSERCIPAPVAASSPMKPWSISFSPAWQSAVDEFWAMGRTRDGLALPGLRADAVVGEGAGVAPEAICACRQCRRPCVASRE